MHLLSSNTRVAVPVQSPPTNYTFFILPIMNYLTILKTLTMMLKLVPIYSILFIFTVGREFPKSGQIALLGCVGVGVSVFLGCFPLAYRKISSSSSLGSLSSSLSQRFFSFPGSPQKHLSTIALSPIFVSLMISLVNRMTYLFSIFLPFSNFSLMRKMLAQVSWSNFPSLANLMLVAMLSAVSHWRAQASFFSQTFYIISFLSFWMLVTISQSLESIVIAYYHSQSSYERNSSICTFRRFSGTSLCLLAAAWEWTDVHCSQQLT